MFRPGNIKETLSLKKKDVANAKSNPKHLKIRKDVAFKQKSQLPDSYEHDEDWHYH